MNIDTDTLIADLARRDVPFLNYDASETLESLADSVLISGLATDVDARVRLALIPLFLRHPWLSNALPDLTLTPLADAHLKAYYSAAVALQSLYAPQLQVLFGLQPRLIDWFKETLPIRGDTEMERLISIARYHAQHSGFDLNWVGTYRHGAERFLKHEGRKTTRAPLFG